MKRDLGSDSIWICIFLFWREIHAWEYKFRRCFNFDFWQILPGFQRKLRTCAFAYYGYLVGIFVNMLCGNRLGQTSISKTSLSDTLNGRFPIVAFVSRIPTPMNAFRICSAPGGIESCAWSQRPVGGYTGILPCDGNIMAWSYISHLNALISSRQRSIANAAVSMSGSLYIIVTRHLGPSSFPKLLKNVKVWSRVILRGCMTDSSMLFSWRSSSTWFANARFVCQRICALWRIVSPWDVSSELASSLSRIALLPPYNSITSPKNTRGNPRHLIVSVTPGTA
jgi:hypothetical protein